jgi:phytoene synthase
MKILFDKLSADVSKTTTRTYSTSFSMGIYLLDNNIRNDVYSVYGFVRLADEIVDSFQGYEQRYLLSKLKQETYEAIYSGISLNPLLNSFQHTVNQYNIDHDLIETFLQSMEMDLDRVEHNTETYNKYILGSAEVVGLMCLHIFTDSKEKFKQLKPYAMKLGSAFQKVNFLRDMKDDYQLLGRCYFPGLDLADFNVACKQTIELEIETEFAIGLEGIKMLPSSCKSGVYLAYIYYKSLFDKIKKLPPHRILTERTRINNGRKIGMMINCMFQNKMNWV